MIFKNYQDSHAVGIAVAQPYGFKNKSHLIMSKVIPYCHCAYVWQWQYPTPTAWELVLSLDMISLFSTYKISNLAVAGIELVSILDIDLRRWLFFFISNFFDGFFDSFFIFLNWPFFLSWSVRLLTSFDFFETKAGFGRVVSDLFSDVGESRWRGLGPSLKFK